MGIFKKTDEERQDFQKKSEERLKVLKIKLKLK